MSQVSQLVTIYLRIFSAHLQVKACAKEAKEAKRTTINCGDTST